MDRRQRFGKRHQVVLPISSSLGKTSSSTRPKLFDRAGHHPPHLVLREALGERVQRQQPHFGLVFGAVEPGDARVGHFPAPAAEPRLGRKAARAALRETYRA